MARPGITGFVDPRTGEWREIIEPDAPATARQLAALNRAGCLALIPPGHAATITKGVAADRLAEARREGSW